MAHFLLMTTRTPQFNPDDIPAHYEHLDRLKQQGRLVMWGPFSDKTGGAYLITAETIEEAQAIGNADPYIINGSATVAVKEWLFQKP